MPKFNSSTLSASEKRQFSTTLFHDGDTWKVLPFDAANNGAQMEGRETIHPVLRVQRVVNGQPVGNIERIFISSLYLADETADGVSLPKIGTVNAIVRSTWDNPAYTSDSAATAAIISAIAAQKPDCIITCSRKLAKDAEGNILKKLTFEGNLRPIVQMNWNL